MSNVQSGHRSLQNNNVKWSYSVYSRKHELRRVTNYFLLVLRYSSSYYLGYFPTLVWFHVTHLILVCVGDSFPHTSLS